jgi:ATP-dependent Lon protease
MEIIDPGLHPQEKKQIARRVPRAQAARRARPRRPSASSSPTTRDEIIDSYTREAGVRNLEREIGSVCRGVAVKVAEGKRRSTVVGVDEVRQYLGPIKFVSEVAERTSEPGVAPAWRGPRSAATSCSSRPPRCPARASSDAHRSARRRHEGVGDRGAVVVRSRAAALGLDPGDFLENVDLHVHVPAGHPQGRSVGRRHDVTALVSLLIGVPVRPDVAMTGEITLRGNVLPVGGIKEKLLAAHRAGIKRVAWVPPGALRASLLARSS